MGDISDASREQSSGIEQVSLAVSQMDEVTQQNAAFVITSYSIHYTKLYELSANRANASRRELIAGGMDGSKVLRVVGLSSTVLFDKNDPLNSRNNFV